MVWRVFFIGPMSQGLESRLSDLREFFINRLIQKHGYSKFDPTEGAIGVVLEKAGDQVVVVIPSEQGLATDITTNVFHQIDNADLILADLTEYRPPVMYELAMAHALGIETILISDGKEKETFYFNQTRYNKIDFHSEPWSCLTLEDEIDRWVRGKSKSSYAENPLARFYGVPLIDISAASGLAAGYYDNFARPVLATGLIVERQLDQTQMERPIRGLIVARPTSLSKGIPHFEGILRKKLEAVYGENLKKGSSDNYFIRVAEEDGHKRTPLYIVNDYVIDVPRTIFSLRQSHRLKREKLKVDPHLTTNMQSVLIGCFFKNLAQWISEDHHLEPKFESGRIAFHMAEIDTIPTLIPT